MHSASRQPDADGTGWCQSQPSAFVQSVSPSLWQSVAMLAVVLADGVDTAVDVVHGVSQSWWHLLEIKIKSFTKLHSSFNSMPQYLTSSSGQDAAAAASGCLVVVGTDLACAKTGRRKKRWTSRRWPWWRDRLQTEETGAVVVGGNVDVWGLFVEDDVVAFNGLSLSSPRWLLPTSLHRIAGRKEKCITRGLGGSFVFFLSSTARSALGPGAPKRMDLYIYGREGREDVRKMLEG